MTLAAPPPAVRSVRPRRRHSAGFTLLELMIVVAIIGITAALAGPAIGRALAISRADRANHDMVRLLRFARSQAVAYGRAYLIHFNTGGDGRAELWQGATSACRLENWTTVMGAGACASPGFPTGNCLDYVDSVQYAAGVHGVRFTSVAGTDICFQPNGDALTRPSGGGGAFSVPATGMIRITTVRLEGGSPAGDPLRGVVLPVGGAPRMLR